MPLYEAAAEMNRHRRKSIVLLGSVSSKALLVSRLFRTGDNVAFPDAVAALHGPAIPERKDRLNLAGR